MCPAPPKHSPPPRGAASRRGRSPDPHRQRRCAPATCRDTRQSTGHVKVRQDERTVSADTMTYDYNTGKLGVTGQRRLRGSEASHQERRRHLRRARRREFRQGRLSRSSTATAAASPARSSVHPDGKVDLEQVRYTTCPVGNQDWMLQASSINLDTQNQEGLRPRRASCASRTCRSSTRRTSRFPLGDERKSGLLVPELRALEQQRLPAGGPLLLQSRAELRPDPHARLHVRARRAARRGFPLPDREFARLRSTAISCRTTSRNTATAHSSISPTSPTSSAGCVSTPTSPASATCNYFSDFAVGSRADQRDLPGAPRRGEILR